MATTKPSTLGYHDILIREGVHPPVTLRAQATGIFPGLCVTVDGNTWPDAELVDAIGESCIGVAGNDGNQDVDLTHADNEQFPCYLTGSAAQVVCYHAANGGSVVAGDILVAQSVEAAGYVETLQKALEDFVADGSAGTILATQILHFESLVGRALETHASSGTVTPIKVLLSI